MDRFKDKPLIYGRDDCARMVAFALKRQGLKISLLAGGRYSTPLGAAKALKALGHKTLLDAVDTRLDRIPPAACLAGDILALPAESFGGALMLAVGNGRAFGYFEGRFQVGQPLLFVTGWRSINHG